MTVIKFTQLQCETITVTNGDIMEHVIEKRKEFVEHWKEMEEVYLNICEYDKQLGNELLEDHDKHKFDYTEIGTKIWI